MTEDFQASMTRLMEEIQPKTEQQTKFLEQAVLASIQAKLAVKGLDFEIDRQQENARNNWENTRQLEAQRLFSRIRKNPRVTPLLLQQTLAGCQLLIEEWTALKEAAVQPGGWNDNQISTAFDLLGMPQIYRNYSEKICPKDCADLSLYQESLARAEIDRLEALAVRSLIPADKAEREAVANTLRSLVSPEGMRYLRYLNTANGRVIRYFELATGKKSLPGPLLQDDSPKTVMPPVIEKSPVPPFAPPPVPIVEQLPKLVTTNLLNPFEQVREAILTFAIEVKREQLTTKAMRKRHRQIMDDHKPLFVEYIQAGGFTEAEVQVELVSLDAFARIHLGPSL